MQRIRTLAAMAMTVALCATCSMAADATKDWPEFHGSKRDNLSGETGLLKAWPAGGPTLAWKTKGIGGGFSSVSVVKGRIYTAGDEGGDSCVYALNESDGKQVWKAKLGRSGGGGGYPGPRATPTVDGDLLYVIGQYGDVVCYAAADGKEVWRTNLNSDHGGKMMSGWGNSESIVVEGNAVLCTPGGGRGTVLALDKKSGKPLWRSKDFTDAAAYMAPLVTEIHGVRQAIVFTDASVAGIDVKNGDLLWKAARPGKTAVIPTPVVHNNHVFVTSGYGIGCDLFKVEKQGNKFAASKVYSNKNMTNHHGGVILIDGIVYGHSDRGGWTALDVMTGEPKNVNKGVCGKGTISYADGCFYLRDEGSGVIVLTEANASFKESGRFNQPDRSDKKAWPHMVIANGKLYVRDQDLLLCYDIKGK